MTPIAHPYPAVLLIVHADILLDPCVAVVQIVVDYSVSAPQRQHLQDVLRDTTTLLVFSKYLRRSKIATRAYYTINNLPITFKLAQRRSLYEIRTSAPRDYIGQRWTLGTS